jgi:uncharacterized lipoprotein YddW (UPF0748 family)
MARRFLVALFLLIACALPVFAQSRKGELRGVWIGSGYDRDWSAIVKSLKENGFNAIFPNMCTGGAAFYPSKVLPAAAGGKQGRDELAEALKAAKQYGIEVHVWRINWRLENCPEEVLKRYEAQGRLMRNAEGKLVRDDPNDNPRMDWLCPSDLTNRNLERDAMLELVRRYDIAGIQFDYMRFPGPTYCYCDHCRVQFERETGSKKVEDWPADCVGEGKRAKEYERWRQGLQTSLVKEISEEAHRIKPGIYVSLAAWPEEEVARHQVLQDWPEWVKQGWLDFICFMNYGTDVGQVASQLKAGLNVVGGAVAVYSGLGAFLMKDAAELIAQVKEVREVGADGFVGFAYYSGELDKWLPALRETVTSSDPDPMPHWGPPAILSIAGPAVLAPEADHRVKAGGRLTADLKLGIPAPAPNAIADEGALQAASILRQATNSRRPVGSLEPNTTSTGMADETYRITGRMVLETPTGNTLAVLGAFTADWQYLKQLTFTAPEGPFRLAVYGTEQVGEGEREFVFRGILLNGVEAKESEAAPRADTAQGRVTGLIADFLKRVKPEDIAGVDAAVLLRVDGEGGGDWWVRAKEGKCESGEGRIEKPDLSITISAQDLLSLARGEADPYALWQSGRLAASGDMALLKQLIPLLWKSGSE